MTLTCVLFFTPTGQKDVVAYKKDCAEKDRADLCYRGEEAQVQRLKLEHLRLQEKMIGEKNKKLESLARDDVKEYVQECKRKKTHVTRW